MVGIECLRKTRSDLATAMNIQPIIQGGEVCTGTATTRAVLTRIWDLHIGGGEDCEPASASRIGAHTTDAARSCRRLPWQPVHERPRRLVRRTGRLFVIAAAKPGSADVLCSQLVADKSGAEPGCQLYTLLGFTRSPAVFRPSKRWTDRVALEVRMTNSSNSSRSSTMFWQAFHAALHERGVSPSGYRQRQQARAEGEAREYRADRGFARRSLP
jgi:hypothetical protein